MSRDRVRFVREHDRYPTLDGRHLPGHDGKTWHIALGPDGQTVYCGKIIPGAPLVWRAFEEGDPTGPICAMCRIVKDNPGINFNEQVPTGETVSFMGVVFDKKEKRYVRVKRIIHSPFWNRVHNLVAHPMLAIYRPWGERLHDWTAEKMYAGPQSLEEEEDVDITAVRD